MKINTKDLTCSQLALIFNAFSDKPVKKFSSKASGLKRLEFLCENEIPADFDQEQLDMYAESLPEELRERITLKGKKKSKATPKERTRPVGEVKPSSERTLTKGKFAGVTLVALVPFNPYNANGRRNINFERILSGGCDTRESYENDGGASADLFTFINTGYVAPLDEADLAKFKSGKLTAKTLRKKFYKELNLRTPLETIEKRVKAWQKENK